jgi:hypothetical protein
MILDAEYKPAVLEEVTQVCTNLNKEEQHKLLEFLQIYEHLFDGTVGEFKMDPTLNRQRSQTSTCLPICCS